jgi:hypothetical protein
MVVRSSTSLADPTTLTIFAGEMESSCTVSYSGGQEISISSQVDGYHNLYGLHRILQLNTQDVIH